MREESPSHDHEGRGAGAGASGDASDDKGKGGKDQDSGDKDKGRSKEGAGHEASRDHDTPAKSDAGKEADKPKSGAEAASNENATERSQSKQTNKPESDRAPSTRPSGGEGPTVKSASPEMAGSSSDRQTPKEPAPAAAQPSEGQKARDQQKALAGFLKDNKNPTEAQTQALAEKLVGAGKKDKVELERYKTNKGEIAGKLTVKGEDGTVKEVDVRAREVNGKLAVDGVSRTISGNNKREIRSRDAGAPGTESPQGPGSIETGRAPSEPARIVERFHQSFKIGAGSPKDNAGAPVGRRAQDPKAAPSTPDEKRPAERPERGERPERHTPIPRANDRPTPTAQPERPLQFPNPVPNPMPGPRPLYIPPGSVQPPRYWPGLKIAGKGAFGTIGALAAFGVFSAAPAELAAVAAILAFTGLVGGVVAIGVGAALVLASLGQTPEQAQKSAEQFENMEPLTNPISGPSSVLANLATKGNKTTAEDILEGAKFADRVQKIIDLIHSADELGGGGGLKELGGLAKTYGEIVSDDNKEQREKKARESQRSEIQIRP